MNSFEYYWAVYDIFFRTERYSKAGKGLFLYDMSPVPGLVFILEIHYSTLGSGFDSFH